MAFWLSKSRSISSLLGKRIGLLTILHERNKGSFLHSRRDGVFRYKNSPEFSTKSATFSATGQRFKSSKTGEQVELPSSDEDDDEYNYSQTKITNNKTINKNNKASALSASCISQILQPNMKIRNVHKITTYDTFMQKYDSVGEYNDIPLFEQDVDVVQAIVRQQQINAEDYDWVYQ